MLVIEEAVSKIPEWKDKRISITPLSGGLTNSNFKVEVDGTPYFVRVPGASTELLAINCENEHYNSKAAYEAGVGPKINYLQICEEHSITIPDGYLERMPTVQTIEGALSVKSLGTVPCNNDLLAENYLDDGEKLWLIDYEYSGNNDPTFELGNPCQEMQFSNSQIAEVCSGYFGEATPNMIARMKLNMIMSDVAGDCGPPSRRISRPSNSTSGAGRSSAGAGQRRRWI